MAETTIGTEYKLEKPVEEAVLYEKIEKHIARVTLNRPEKHNALFPPDMFLELGRKIRMGADDDEVKVIILKGAGPSFCTGDDLNRAPYEALGGGPGSRPPQSVRIRGMHDLLEGTGLYFCPKIIIGQAHGHVIGQGASILVACDLVIAGESTRISRFEQRIGFAGLGSHFVLALLTLGPKRLTEWLLTGEVIDAWQAKEWGLVNRVVPDDKLDEETLRWGKAISLHSTDGLIIGKFYRQVALEILGESAMNRSWDLAWALMTNLKWRDDEFNFLKSRLAEGRTGRAFAKREDRWRELGF